VETEFHARFHDSNEAAQDTYRHFQVLGAQDVAEAISYLIGAPDHVQIHDILMRPRDQPS
jgi:NADP-dependent 3-hydroxy acid dehydrogenase YdfG